LFSGLPLPESGSLVGEFKSRLLKEGAKIEEARGAEYFAVSFHGPAVILLAHGSVGHGLWGIRHDIVERCMKTEERFREEGVRWGAVLLDDSSGRGFWINGKHVQELSDSFSTTKQQYLYHKRALEASDGIRGYFIGIRDFLDKAGFSSDAH
jgi:hypothetical protein